MKCLCVIDMQLGVMSARIEKILPKIKWLINHFHESGYQVIFTRFINTYNSYYSRELKWYKLLNANEQALLPGLNEYGDPVFDKNHYNSWTKPFCKHLKKKKIIECYFVGADTDACIYQSALMAIEHKIEPFVIKDACTSTSSRLHSIGLGSLMRQIGFHHIISTQHLIGE